MSLGEELHKLGYSLFEEFVRVVESIPTKYKAIVSSGSQVTVIPALSKTNINPTHILAYENHHSKEEKIEIIAKDWGVNTEEIFYFTDTLADVFELQSLISEDKLIGVTWGYCTKEELLRELIAECILDEPSDIHKVL